MKKIFSISRAGLRHLAALAAFCALALGMIAYTDRVLWDKNGTIMGFYEEPKNSVDVIYVGGSHTNAAVSPTQIYEEYGTTGYVLYSWSQPIWTAYHYTLEALKTQKPKVVVVDVFGMVYGNTYMTDVDMNSVSDDYSLLIPPSLNRIQLAMAMSRCQTEHKPFYRYASLLRYHNRWKALTKQDLLWPLQSYRTTGKGFGPLYTTESYQLHQPADITPNGEAAYAWSKVYLQKLVELSKQQGFQLVAVNFPYIAEDIEYDIFAWTRQYCEENGVPFLDYLLEDTAAQAGFDYETDMAEHAHVNYKGAAKLTAHLGKFLHDNYALPDHRGEAAYAQWESDAAFERRNLQDMDLCMTSDLNELLTKAMTPNYVVLLATCGDLTAADSTAVAAALENHGISAQCFAQPGWQMVASYSTGKGVMQTTFGPGQTGTQQALLEDGSGLTVSSDGNAAVQRAGDAKTGELADQSRNRPGLNIVVADAATGKLVYSVSYSTLHDYTAYTA